MKTTPNIKNQEIKKIEPNQGSDNLRQDWVECTLGEVFDFIGGGTPSKSNPDYWNGNIPWASIKDLKGDNLISTQDFITEEGLKNSSANIANKNEIILATRISPGTPILSKIKTAINQDLKVAKPKIESEIEYFFWLFNTLKPEILKLSSGTTVLGINLPNLKSVEFLLPPIHIQKAIVKKIEELFSSLDSGIADLKKAQDQLVVYRQAVLKKAFEGGYTQPNTEKKDILINGLKSSIPKNWKVCKIGSIAKLQGGFAFKSAEFTDSGIPIVKIKNVHYQNIDWSDKTFVSSSRMEEFNSYSLNKGDVLIAMTRPVIKSLNNIKTVVVKESDLPALLNQRVGRFVINGELNKNFLKYFIFTDFFKRRVLKESSSSQQPNISSTKIEKFDFILPETIHEQENIVREVESRLSVCDKLEENIATSLEKARALRQSILKKAFEGKLLSAAEIKECKSDKEYEPASVLLERIREEKKKK
ncbi:restriction endonuclease subunit S [Bizionia sp.]|uniref:restriction endonuclease subunit S n=1 Tax=Bizionia sp. TaxID=1954480 RepID=UPI003A8E6427